jgi:Ser/Thr protein kinase RdoA (MazF antagonist)
MIKIAIEDIAQALQEAKIPKEQQGIVLNHLQQVVEEEKAQKEAEKIPTQKNEFGVVIFDAENKLAGMEFTASVFTIKQGDDMGAVLGKISQAARDQNATSKRKKWNFDSLGSAIQGLKRKFIKPYNINLKTKNPCRVLVSNNSL